MLELLDFWLVRVALVLSGLAVFAHLIWNLAIQRWKNRDGVDQDRNVDSGDRTLTKVRLLLSEAATGIVDAQPGIDVDDRRASVLFGAYYFDVLRFLEMAFVVNHADDMRHYVQSRRDDSMGNAEMMASFLKNLEKESNQMSWTQGLCFQ